jgi:hypothetical protein
MTDVLADIVVYLFLSIIVGAGALGTFCAWRDNRAQRGKDDAHRPDDETGANPD